MLKIPQILIFLAALLSLGGGHPLISGGGVIRSQKSGFKWRPFNSVDENPRRISPFVAALAENSAPHPAILHGNGFVSFGVLLRTSGVFFKKISSRNPTILRISRTSGVDILTPQTKFFSLFKFFERFSDFLRFSEF